MCSSHNCPLVLLVLQLCISLSFFGSYGSLILVVLWFLCFFGFRGSCRKIASCTPSGQVMHHCAKHCVTKLHAVLQMMDTRWNSCAWCCRSRSRFYFCNSCTQCCTAVSGPLVIWATLSCNLSGNNVALQVEMVCCALPPPRATNFHVANSRSDTYFLQHENLLRKVVIRATNYLNLQRDIVARQVARSLPYTWP